MTSCFFFTICRIFDGFVARTDYDDVSEAAEYYRRHIDDDKMQHISLIGYGLNGVTTILEQHK
jgi:hypothetical protein